MGICSSDDYELKSTNYQLKLKQLETIIQSEEKRNFRLLHRLEALSEANSDLAVKNLELLEDRKKLIADIKSSQRRLEKLHKVFLTVEQP